MSNQRRDIEMNYDGLIFEENEAKQERARKSLSTGPEKLREIVSFIHRHRPGAPTRLCGRIFGGFSCVYRLMYNDGSSAVLKVPLPTCRFPDDKTRYEVATMRFVSVHTSIPVPKVHHWGMAAENPLGLGAFIIMDWIDHDMIMDYALGDREARMADPAEDEPRQSYLYEQVANILLQLYHLRFSRMGSLQYVDVDAQTSDDRGGIPKTRSRTDDGGNGDGDDDVSNIKLAGSAIPMNANEIARHTSLPVTTLSRLLPGPMKSSKEWYSAMADRHLAQLLFQHNDAVIDENDARDRYVARYMFRRLARQGRLSSDEEEDEEKKRGFPLFSEDFRPGNILLDRDLRVVGVIDWEWAYAAPASYSWNPPMWLLLDEPPAWTYKDRGRTLDDWVTACEPRMRVFLQAMERAEKKLPHSSASSSSSPSSKKPSGSNHNNNEIPLSRRMRETWETRSWMLSFNAQCSWLVDYAYWTYLDPRFVAGSEIDGAVLGAYKARLGMLSESERAAMDQFVARKMKENTTNKLVRWSDEEAEKQLTSFLNV